MAGRDSMQSVFCMGQAASVRELCDSDRVLFKVLQYAVSLKPYYNPLSIQSGHYWSYIWSNITYYYYYLKFPT